MIRIVHDAGVQARTCLGQRDEGGHLPRRLATRRGAAVEGECKTRKHSVFDHELDYQSAREDENNPVLLQPGRLTTTVRWETRDATAFIFELVWGWWRMFLAVYVADVKGKARKIPQLQPHHRIPVDWNAINLSHINCFTDDFTVASSGHNSLTNQTTLVFSNLHRLHFIRLSFHHLL